MEDRSGYVYLLKAHKPFEECYKIGRTKEPKNRLREFGVKLPYKVTPLLVTKAEDMFAEEAWLHRQFTDSRVDGEWFKLSEADVIATRAYYLAIEADRLFGKLVDRMHSHWHIDFDENRADGYVGMSVRLARVTARAGQRLQRRFAFLELAKRATGRLSPAPSDETGGGAAQPTPFNLSRTGKEVTMQTESVRTRLWVCPRGHRESDDEVAPGQMPRTVYRMDCGVAPYEWDEVTEVGAAQSLRPTRPEVAYA